MLHYPAASLSAGYGYSSHPSYPSYPSGLLLLSRYSNARYARLDVPDWSFRPRPGHNRTDPSGAISRVRSAVRIRTRIRGKTPGARLVEKFIIREPVGSAGSEAKGLFAKNPGPVVSGKDDRGGEGPAISVSENCADLCVKVPAAVGKPAENSPETAKFSRILPQSPKSAFKFSKNSSESPQSLFKFPTNSRDSKNSPNSPENTSRNPSVPPKSDRTPTNSPTTDFDEFSTTPSENSAKKDETSPKSKKRLKAYAKSKKTDLLKKAPDKCATSGSESDKCDISSEIPSDIGPFEQVSKRQSFEESSDDFDPKNAPKLLNFTAKAPQGVQKVQPLKPHFDNNNQIRSESAPSNCVSETKVKVSTNAKCAEAKTQSKFSVPISPIQITAVGGRNTENSVEFEGIPSILNCTEKSSEIVHKPIAVRAERKIEENRPNKDFSEKPSDFSKRETTEPTKTVLKFDKTQQRATTGGPTRENLSDATLPNSTQIKNLESVSNLIHAQNFEQLKTIDIDEKRVSDGHCKNNVKSETKVSPVAENLSGNCIAKPHEEQLTVAQKFESENLEHKAAKDSNLEHLKDRSGGKAVKEAEPKKLVKTQAKGESKKVEPKPFESEQRDTFKAAKRVENEVLRENSVENLTEEAAKETESKKVEQKPTVQRDTVKAIENKALSENIAKNLPEEAAKETETKKVEENPTGQRDTVKAVKAVENKTFSEDIAKHLPEEAEKEAETKKVEENPSGQRDTVKAIENKALSENIAKNLPEEAVKETETKKDTVKAIENDLHENGAEIVPELNGENGVLKAKNKKKVDDNNNRVLCLRDLSELLSLYDEFRVVGAETKSDDLGEDWEILDVVVDMEGTKKKKKVIVKKKGSKVKVRPIEAKPPAKNSGDVTASPGDIMRQLSKKRVSLADDELNLVGFSVDRKTSITDEVLVEEAALLDKMIRKELKDARKSSLAFPPIAEDKEVADALAALAAKAARTPSPKRWVPSPQERREMWKKNALRQSKKGLGGFFKPQAPSPTSSSESSECDVNCHQKCQELMPNLCGVNQKLMVEALQCLKRDRRSASGPHTRTSLFKLDSESEDSQCDGRVTPPAPPAKTLPRFRTYTITDFQFLKVLGKGSFGKVLLAELKGSQCYYAVKCLKKDVVLEDDDVECTMIERKVLALGTGHPYFCHLFCTFQTESHLFFVMEYLNGGDLMFHIQQSGRFDEGRARFYAAEIVSALAFLHKLGIVYRDLKLDNVLLDFDGHVRIADFGMCKLQIYLDKTTDTFCGTPDYMAPEIIKGLNYNHCVDWWSFGILLYEMLVGQSPFSGCDEDHLFWSICNERPHMPRHLSQPAVAILRELLEKDWTKRLGSSEFGSQDVMSHRFFDGMRWHLLERRQVDPPYKPTTKHPLDTKYFDRAFTSEKPVLTPVDKAILESMDQSQFEGFSYTNPNATE